MVSTQLKTAKDLLEMEDHWPGYELIEGVLVEVTPPNPEHAYIVANLAGILRDQVQRRRLGRVYAGDPGMLLRENPDTVLGPDLAVVAANRLPFDQSAYMKIPPDLAVEVVSPGNTRREIERKINLYLEFGVKTIWIVYPRERRVAVHTPGASPRVFNDTNEITGGDVLPGLNFPVSEIFDD